MKSSVLLEHGQISDKGSWNERSTSFDIQNLYGSSPPTYTTTARRPIQITASSVSSSISCSPKINLRERPKEIASSNLTQSMRSGMSNTTLKMESHAKRPFASLSRPPLPVPLYTTHPNDKKPASVSNLSSKISRFTDHSKVNTVSSSSPRVAATLARPSETLGSKVARLAEDRPGNPDAEMMRRGYRTEPSSFSFSQDFLDATVDHVFHGQPAELSQAEIIELSRPKRICRPKPQAGNFGASYREETEVAVSEDGTSSVSSYSTLPSSISSPDLSLFRRPIIAEPKGESLLSKQSQYAFAAISRIPFTLGNYGKS